MTTGADPEAGSHETVAEPQKTEPASTGGAASPTWADVQVQLESRFQLAKKTDTLVALAWQVPGPQGNVVQWVRVSPVRVSVRASEQLWLAVLADICPEAGMSPASALAYLNQLSIGGIMLWRGAYLLRQMVPLAFFDLRGLESLVRCVAHEAVRLRLGLSGHVKTLDSDLSRMFEE